MAVDGAALFWLRSVGYVLLSIPQCSAPERARCSNGYDVTAANLTPRSAEVSVDGNGRKTEVASPVIIKVLFKVSVQHSANVSALNRSWGHAAALVALRMDNTERVGRHMT